MAILLPKVIALFKRPLASVNLGNRWYDLVNKRPDRRRRDHLRPASPYTLCGTKLASCVRSWAVQTLLVW